jgi:hypothetical protein
MSEKESRRPSKSEPWQHLVTFQARHRRSDRPFDVLVLIRNRPFFIGDTPLNLAWVRISGYKNGVFTGTVIVPPELPNSDAKKGREISFIAPNGWEYPIMVPNTYLDEMAAWSVGPCSKCASTQLLDTPSDLIKLLPSSGDKLEAFTAFCYVCGGSQIVTRAAQQQRRKSQ